MISNRIILSSAMVLSAWLLAPGCSSKDGGDSGPLGTAQAAVTNVPSDGTVACIAITSTGSWANTQSFDVMPGESTVFTLNGIPTGTVRFEGSAYPTACALVTPSSVPTWVSIPVLATVMVGETTMVSLDLQQAGSSSVGVDFMPTPTCRSNGLPCLSGGECCSGSCGANNTCAPAGACVAGQTMCGAACTDLGKDPANCGGCGNVCPPIFTCSAGACLPSICPPQLVQCGPACIDPTSDPNNCGGCGIACPAAESCVGGVCTGNSCTPRTCADLGVKCGVQGDGCGNIIDCGSCPAGQTCGGGGPGFCGSSTCTPTTCAAQGVSCGDVGDGCGGLIDCGTCPAPLTCGAGGVCILGAPTCTDGIMDGSETDVDCGGGVCPLCVSGNKCLANADCLTNVCAGGICL